MYRCSFSNLQMCVTCTVKFDATELIPKDSTLILNFENTQSELLRNVLKFSLDLRRRYQRVTVAATTMRFDDSLQSQIEYERVAHRLQGQNVRQLHALVQYDVRPGVHRRLRNYQVTQLPGGDRCFRKLRLRD